MNKVLLIFTIVFSLLLMYWGLMAAAGSFFVMGMETAYSQKPLNFSPKSTIAYDAYLFGVYPIVVETSGKNNCTIMMADGPIKKVELYLFGVYPIVVETSGKNNCTIMMADGPIKKVELDRRVNGKEKHYKAYHLFIENYQCFSSST